MKLYLAPMEGITGHIFRNIHRKYFATADRYFTPFISMSRKLSPRAKRDILPENNQGIDLIPQIMVADAKEALYLSYKISEYGYSQLNINAGCPSGTVVTKHRGAGLLKEPEYLESLLYGIYSSDERLDYSIKLRLGWKDIKEWENISKIVGKYPFTEVIIHGRVREEFYNGDAHREALNIAQVNITSPISYNGDIYTIEDYQKLTEDYPFIDSVMIGRGILRNPGLFDEILTGNKPQKEITLTFINELFDMYFDIYQDEINTLYRMKELWYYLGLSHPQGEKDLKIIKKTRSVLEYKEAAKRILLK